MALAQWTNRSSRRARSRVVGNPSRDRLTPAVARPGPSLTPRRATERSSAGPDRSDHADGGARPRRPRRAHHETSKRAAGDRAPRHCPLVTFAELHPREPQRRRPLSAHQPPAARTRPTSPPQTPQNPSSTTHPHAARRRPRHTTPAAPLSCSAFPSLCLPTPTDHHLYPVLLTTLHTRPVPPPTTSCAGP